MLMKSFFSSKVPMAFFLLSSFLYISCYEKSNDTGLQSNQPLAENFTDYWYAGQAELTSYALEQARYGELHKGEAVLIYVTEDFHDKKQVKADRKHTSNHPVLKLNATKKFLTGIYPYSIMSSTFYPVANNQHAIKTSFSAQEWCGHIYMQLNNREKYELEMHSYFESQADHELGLSKALLENEIWTQLRIDPKSLALGETEMIPSLEFLAMNHQEVKPYAVKLSMSEAQGLMVYTMDYPELMRSLNIRFDKNFPYTIQGWEETTMSGDAYPYPLVTKARRIKTMKSDYWNKNKNSDRDLRIRMGLQ